ncbi:unnamed protein product [Orchesella dallaii]|uniref:Vitellogenin domain-containing protein n=1 Tax=Orchesella dallaii TaxID=48710 RepID=A0ABP1Q5R8_9HEXA
MLKALVSLFQVNPTSRADLPDGFTIENDSKGQCLTKIIQCSGSKTKYIKFKSSRLCSMNEDVTISHNLKYEIQQFEAAINKYTSINDLCEESSSDLDSESETSDKRTGITTCIIEKNGEGLVTSASCTEEEDALELSPAPIVNGRYFGSASLKLGEIKPTIVPTPLDMRVSYYKTNIRQLDVIKGVHDVDDKSAESDDDDFFPRIEIILNNLTNSTKRSELKSWEVQQNIKDFRQLIRGSSNGDNLVKYLEQQINISTSEKSINLFLSMLTLEASEENVLKFWRTILSKKLLKDQISHEDLENQILKLLNTFSNIVPTVKVIEFCKLIVDYVEDVDNGASNNMKITAFMTFSQLLNQFCNRMEEQNGESFCTKNIIIQSWMNSTILEKMGDSENHFDQIIRLESFTNLKAHSNYLCEQIFDERKAESLGLWTLLSCYRDEPCNSKSKDYFRKLIEAEETRSNVKITAFLAMSKCFDNEDEEIIRNIFTDCEPHNRELLNFIVQYKENRDFYGKVDDALAGIEIQSESGCALRRTRTTSQSPKITSGSNTFAIIKIPALPVQLSLETNMLYFDSPYVIPELVVLKLGAVTAVKHGIPIVDKTMFEVEFYVEKSKSQSMLNYLVTVVVRKLGKTVSLKDISVTEEKLRELYQVMQRKVGEMGQMNGAVGDLALGKLYDIIRKVVNLDIFKVIALPSRSKYIRTISGIPQRMQWDVDGFTGLIIQKQDCLGVMGGDANEDTCQSNLNPVFNLEMSLSLGIGYPDTNQFHIEGLQLQSNLTAELPLSLLFTRRTPNKESSVELIVPSLNRALVKAGVEVRSTEGSTDRLILHINYTHLKLNSDHTLKSLKSS